MRLSFICNHIYINGGWSPWDTRIGGSEEMIVETAKRLAKNHEVTVYHNGRHGIHHGVRYAEHDEYEPGDITINMNFPEMKPQGKTIYWTSLDKQPDLTQFDAVCVISQYAKDHTGVPDNSYIVPPGYDPLVIYPERKIPKQCFYASSPDRGLDTLLEAWPSVYAAHPDATLLLTYGAPLSNLPGVINLGEVDEPTMNDIYRTSQFWLYPCGGVELYCMTGVKAQASGCVPIVIPHMALAETVKYGVKCTPEVYTQTIIDALGQYNELFPKKLPKYPTWNDTTKKLEEIIQTVYTKNI